MRARRSASSSSRGFTLIELLVVIAIIGILSGVVLASLKSANSKGRDARRAEDMQSVVQALELYANNNNGQYPPTPATGTGCGGTNVAYCLANLGASVVPSFLPSMPHDPLYPNTTSDYRYCRDSSNAQEYLLLRWSESAATYCLASVSALPPVNGCGSLATNYLSC